MHNFQIMIVSVVKVCNANCSFVPQTPTGAFPWTPLGDFLLIGDFRPPDTLDYSPPNENPWRHHALAEYPRKWCLRYTQTIVHWYEGLSGNITGDDLQWPHKVILVTLIILQNTSDYFWKLKLCWTQAQPQSGSCGSNSFLSSLIFPVFSELHC